MRPVKYHRPPTLTDARQCSWRALSFQRGLNVAETKSTGAKRGRKRRGAPLDFSNNTLSQDARAAVMSAFTFVGGVKWLVKLAQQPNPALFVQLLGKCIKTNDGGDAAAGVTFVVQQFNVQAAPTPGVIASPIAEHVPPLRLVANAETRVVEHASALHD